jgi:hypothetical protein
MQLLPGINGLDTQVTSAIIPTFMICASGHSVYRPSNSGSLAMFAAMRRTSSQTLPVLSSFPALFRLQ